MEVWSADQVRDHLQLCTAIVDRLRREVGLTDSTANVVSVDSTSAHDVRAFTSPAYAVAARAAIGLAAASAGVTGCMEAYRRATVAELMTLLTGTAPQPINEVARRWDMMLRDRRDANVRLAAMDPFDTYLGLFDRRFGWRPWLALDLQAGVDAWEEWLDGSWLQPVFGGRAEPAVPAFGHGSALLVDDGRGELAFHAARPQPGAFHGRHAPPDDVTMLFHEALSGCVEIVGRDCVEPAVATRSRLAGHRIDLTAADSDSMGSWRITATDDGRIWLVHSSVPDSLLAPIYNSSAAIGWLDPLSDLLYKAAMSHGWELQSVGCPTHPAERVCWRHQPEIRIEGAESSATVAGRRWTVAAESVEHATAQEKSRRFLEWRRATGHLALPEIVSVRGTDPEQTPRTCVVSSALSVDTLLHDLAQAPPVSELVISAVPLGSRSGFQICDQDGSYVWEAAQPWRVTPVGEGNSVHDDVVEALDQPLDIDAAVGRMQPYRDAGQSWLHLDAAIVGDSGWQDLADLLAGLRHEGVTDTWWYVHKPPGLRLRLHENEVGRLAEFIRQRQADAPGLQIDAIGHYEPELTRFGGAGGLALAHRHFVADSALALKCRTAPAVGADLSRTVGIWTAHAMFMRVAEDRAELRDLWTRLHTAVADSSNSRQEPDPELITIVQRCLTGTFVPTARPADDAVVVRAARWGQRIGDAAADLRRREGLAVRDWAASVVIFHWNRWALTPSVSAPMVNAMLARLPTD